MTDVGKSNGILDVMQNFNLSKQALYDHVGFKEDWAVYAIDDRTGMFWFENGVEVKYAETVDGFNSDASHYVDEIYTQRFYNKWVYRGKDLTMIIVDTHLDGNKFFAFFDNKKEARKT